MTAKEAYALTVSAQRRLQLAKQAREEAQRTADHAVGQLWVSQNKQRILDLIKNRIERGLVEVNVSYEAVLVPHYLSAWLSPLGYTVEFCDVYCKIGWLKGAYTK